MSEPIGDVVRRLRGSETKASLAERAGVHPKYVERLEAGGVPNPGVKTLEKIAKALGVNLAALVAAPTRRRKSA